MITVVVVGILSSIAVVTYSSYLQSSRQSALDQNVQQLVLAEDSYFYENGAFLEGTYSKSDTAFGEALGWTPDNEDGTFIYKVTACAGGTLATCFTITAKDVDEKVTATFTRDRSLGL